MLNNVFTQTYDRLRLFTIQGLDKVIVKMINRHG